MPLYLSQVAYTSETYHTLIHNPQDRIETVVRPAIEKLGGEVVGSWFSFGEYDVVLISKLPDNVTSASFAMAVKAAGTVKDLKTTPLITWEEGIEAMRRAQKTAYRPPSS